MKTSSVFSIPWLACLLMLLAGCETGGTQVVQSYPGQFGVFCPQWSECLSAAQRACRGVGYSIERASPEKGELEVICQDGNRRQEPSARTPEQLRERCLQSPDYPC